MLELRNETIRLTVREDAGEIVVTDLPRRCSWRLDASRVAYRRYGSGGHECPEIVRGKIPMDREHLAGGRAEKRGSAIQITYSLPEGTIRYTWRLAEDHVEIGLACNMDSVEFIALPGAFVPIEGSHQIAVPIYQGVICKDSGRLWERSFPSGGHECFSMAMGAVIGETGALLVTQESVTDWVGTYGQAEAGPFFVFEQRRCPVDGWYERRVRLYPVDNNITAICKRYRRRVIERGEFASWDEKIERKPIVENLFGALFAFLGYNRTDQIDYVASARRLKEYGFGAIFYYPVRLCHYSLDFKMGGDEPIWLSDEQIQAIHQIPGSYVSPWAWIYEGLDDGSQQMRRIFRHDKNGELVPGWRIDQFQWYAVCTPYQIEHIKHRLETDMKQMDWIHYDVTAMRPGHVCFNTHHAAHGNRPMGRREDLEYTRRLLGPATNGNRIVSSEGFVDRYTSSYDIGSTKIYPNWGDSPFIAVPMTMLVFHDSCIHDWWEVHNYNRHAGFADDQDHGIGWNSCGKPEKKAAMDALYGCPPNLFPFGKQYAWVDIETRQTYSYLVRLEDDEVQRAIRAALPVARLHKQIGRCEMVSFDFVTDDYAVQTSVFSDGTRIVANISDEDRDTPHGLLKANSWRRI